MSKFIDHIKEKNQPPILFIGSGITKRYCKNAPDWATLLKGFWDQLDFGTDFFGELLSIKADCAEHDSEEKKNYTAFSKIAEIINLEFDRQFYTGKIHLNGLSNEDVFRSNGLIDPFKVAIAQKLKISKDDITISNELDLLAELIAKSQIIITTNYDTFIELLYKKANRSDRLTTYVGANGFFSPTENANELYKIHGCVTKPESIVITESDYKSFEEKEILVSAKLVSMLMENPIVFLGYSLTDVFIRRLIRMITDALSDEERQVFNERLAIIEWKKDELDFIEKIERDESLGCEIQTIQTDNFLRLYGELVGIEQGMSMSSLRRYKSMIRQLILDQTQKGHLDTLLVCEEDIDNIKIDEKKKLVVAIGSEKNVFVYPTNYTYCLDYVSEKDEIPLDIRLRFIAMQHASTRLPVNRILKKELIQSSHLDGGEKEKLLQRIGRASDFESHYNGIQPGNVLIDTSQLEEILSLTAKDDKIYDTISYHIHTLDLKAIKTYLLAQLIYKKENNIRLSTSFRRLMLLYDIVNNKGR